MELQRDLVLCNIYISDLGDKKKENAFIEFADDNLGGTASVLKDGIKI